MGNALFSWEYFIPFMFGTKHLGQYLENDSLKNHWLGLKLVGTKSNKDAIGALVELNTKKGRQIRSIVSGEGFLSDSDKRLIFGLGDESNIEKLSILWPSGEKQTLGNLEADRYWQIEENQGEGKALPIKASATAPPLPYA
jgi:hypothetical protein